MERLHFWTYDETAKSKGGYLMYYSSGNYEAFARPLKPEGIEHKSAYFVGIVLALYSASSLI